MLKLANDTFLIGYGLNGTDMSDFWVYDPSSGNVKQEFIYYELAADSGLSVVQD